VFKLGDGLGIFNEIGSIRGYSMVSSTYNSTIIQIDRASASSVIDLILLATNISLLYFGLAVGAFLSGSSTTGRTIRWDMRHP